MGFIYWKKTFFFICFILGLTVSFAQNNAFVSGWVYDAGENAKVMENVEVLVGQNAGGYTDESGRYSVEVAPGEYMISYSYLGYETHKTKVILEAGKTTNINVKLKSSNLSLETTVITGSAYEKKVSEEVVSIEVISKNLLRNSGIRELGEALERVPGVQIQDGQISIRGGNSYAYGVGSRVLVLSDGISIMTNDLGEANYKLLPIEIVEQVEVIKGASAVQYGSSALNGVVNFRTRWPSEEKPKTQISFIAGIYNPPNMKEKQWWNLDSTGVLGINIIANTFNSPFNHSSTQLPGTLTSMFSHEFKKDNNQWVFGLYTDRVQSYMEKADERRSRFDIKYRKLDTKINGLQYGVISHFMKEENQRFFFSKDLDTNAYRFSQGSDDSYVNAVISPFIEYIDEDYSAYRLDVRYVTRFREGGGTDRDAWDNSVQIRPQITKMHRNFIFTFGVPATLGASVSNLYSEWRKNFMVAGFGQAEYKTRRLSLILGARAEALGVDSILDFTRPIVRTGFNYQLTRSTFIKGNVGQAYRMPTIAERFLVADFAGGVGIIPTPSLRPETGYTSEVAILQGLNKGKFKGGFEGTFFWNEFKNYVEYQFGLYDNKGENGEVLFPGKPEKIFGLKPINLSNVRIAGVETRIFGSGEVSKNLQINGNIGYTYTYPGNLASDSLRNTNADSLRNVLTYMGYFFSDWNKQLATDPHRGFTRVSPFRSRHLLRGDIEAVFKGINLGLNANYTSYPESIPDLFVLAIVFLTSDLDGFEEYSAKHIMGDWVFNGRVGYEWKNKYRLGFVINNLSNLEYSTRPGRMEPTRYYQLQFRYTL